MKKNTVFLALILLCALSSAAQPKPPLTLKQAIPLPKVTGRFDHLAIDLGGDRLFIAATGDHAVEVIGLKTGKVLQSIDGLGKPHGLAWDAATGSLYVSDGSLGELRVYKGTPFALAGTIKLSGDADDMAYDAARQLLFVGHGGKDAANPARIAIVNTGDFSVTANVPVDMHPEGLAVDPKSGRVFANLADAGAVVAIDTHARSIAAQWKLTAAEDNVPLAFDAQHRLLYLACRTPGTLIALDAATGKEVASLPAAAGADDLFYDPTLSRIYLIGGSGEVDAYQVDEAKALHPLAVLHTVAGAKTGLFVPAQKLLYLGVPGDGSHAAEIRVYATDSH